MSERFDRRDVLRLTGVSAAGASLAVQSTATQTDETGNGSDSQSPPPIVGDDPPQDLDGDGLYEDINGDGEFNIFDVQLFFSNLGTDVVQENAEFFRFSAPDEDNPEGLSIFDVQAHFNELANEGPVRETNADRAQAAWEEAVANPLPEDETFRAQAYVEMEEATRDDAILVPLYHGKTERFWWDYVDVPKIGAAGRHEQQHNETTVEGDDTLNLISSTFDTLDPIHATDTASSEIINQLYETLTHYPNGVPEPEFKLLDSYAVSDDATTWTFTLRDDIQFHGDGDLTAHDLKYSWERLALSDNSARAEFILDPHPLGLGLEHETDPAEGKGPANVVPDSLGLEVVDDQTLTVHLTEPNPDVLDIVSHTSFAVVPEGYVDDVPGYDGDHEWAEIHQEIANGTGPFELDFFDPEAEAQVVRNDEYHGTVADLEAVHWNVLELDAARWQYITEGNADIFTVPISFYDPGAVDAEVDERGRDVGTYGPVGDLDEAVNYLGVTELSTFYLGFNATNTHRAVRQAVAYVLDKPQFVQTVFGGRAAPAYSFVPPGIWPTGWEGYQDFLDDYEYSAGESDIGGATDVLEAAGFTPEDPAEMELTTYTSPAFETAAELVNDLLSGNGVDIDIEEVPFSTLLSLGEDGALDAYTLGWFWGWRAPTHGSFQLEPKNTNTDKMPAETDGFFLDWHTTLSEEFQDED